jgi:hypothetical protein
MIGRGLKIIEAYGETWHHCPGCQRYLKRDDFAEVRITARCDGGIDPRIAAYSRYVPLHPIDSPRG